MVDLIISEKPSTAKKLADALADGKAIKKTTKGVSYYDITHGDTDILVCSAVGHLYGLAEKEKSGFNYPRFEIEWKPTYEVVKNAEYSKKYLDVIKKLSKDVNDIYIATDYDVEGEVIGLNILRFSCKRKDAKRMKFSTVTDDELREAFANAAPTINWGQAKAGEARHKLDWYWGINISRALTSSLRAAGRFKILSSGRVQGPALKIIVNKEEEIAAFTSEPYWQGAAR